MENKEILDLYTLQTRLKSATEGVFPGKVWVRAEVSAMKARSGGHCYMELSQTESNSLVAKVSAIIWASRFGFVSRYFETETGSPLQVGIKILARVQVNYSQLYGLSLIIDEIDPAFTIGDKEKERQATIARLTAEGLMDKQKSLSICVLPYKLAIVSASDAAGYGDFMKHLHGNIYGFTFRTDLFPALMQGQSAPDSIAAAIEKAAASPEGYDAVLVLRGGGAKLDLVCFDDYRVASAIALCPIPVITAVGHDQDFHICDMVAWRYVKTPTALADFFIDIYADEDQRLSSYASRLKMAFVGKINPMSSKVDLLEARIEGADPRRILAKGYVLALDSKGVVFKSPRGKKPGDRVSMMFADGRLDCDVTDVNIC